MTTFIDIVFVCLALFSRDHNYNTVPLFEILKSNTEQWTCWNHCSGMLKKGPGCSGARFGHPGHDE